MNTSEAGVAERTPSCESSGGRQHQCSTTSLACTPKGEPASAGVALLRHFLQERWKGLTAIAWGDQLRQVRLDEIIYLDTLGVDLLPPTAPEQANGDGLVTMHPAIATEYHTA